MAVDLTKEMSSLTIVITVVPLKSPSSLHNINILLEFLMNPRQNCTL